jgi:preprotein translocase subunit YajC
MTLTLNQFLFIVLTLAAVVVVVFLVMLLIQLRRTAAQAEKTMAEFRELAQGLEVLQTSVQSKVDDLGWIIDASKKAAGVVSQAGQFLSSRALKPASKIWAVLIPVAGILFRRWKSRKEEKNVGE